MNGCDDKYNNKYLYYYQLKPLHFVKDWKQNFFYLFLRMCNIMNAWVLIQNSMHITLLNGNILFSFIVWHLLVTVSNNLFIVVIDGL